MAKALNPPCIHAKRNYDLLRSAQDFSNQTKLIVSNNPHGAKRSQLWRHLIRIVVACVITTAFAAPVRTFAQSCGTPGQQGNGGTLTGVINTYFPATATAAAGATSITLGAGRGSSAPIASGNLLLVIQMQDAAIASTNDGAYGNGVAGDPGSGYSAANDTGRFEFVRATNAVPLAGGTVTFVGTGAGTGLLNTYNNAAASATQGQRRFQVVRVPQYTAAMLSSGLTASAWNGATGGILAIDASQQVTLGGTVSVNGLGFRPGAGLQLAGGSGGANTDYRSLATLLFHGAKGEGIAGTPRYLYDAASGANVDTGLEGYPNGSMARGAPGNAGGGGTDGNPTANDQNSGGGGGGNGGAGGVGGNSWSSNLVVGGFGGVIFAQASSSRMVMGGGGGGGTRNNTPGVTAAGSGSAGGGIVFIRARNVAGTGTITANGAAAFNDTLNDGGGGGGAGGSIFVSTLTGTLTGLTVNAQGGRGGDAWRIQAPGATPGERHGPGGGGGGGVIRLSSAAASLSVAGGANGITTTASDSFGATAGGIGTSVTNLTAASIPGTQSGAQCSPTAISLKSFDAMSYDDEVLIRWQSGYEVDNLGYQVYREQNGNRVRITPSIIAGSALLTRPGIELTAGYSYAWADRLSKNEDAGRVQYWLEDVDIDGTSTWHGPITPYKVTGLSQEQRRAMLLSDLGSLSSGASAQSEWPASSGRPTSPDLGTTRRDVLNQQLSVASQNAVKILVNKDGWMRVTRDELANAGLDAGVDPRRLQLFADGVEQPMVVRPDGSIEFYGKALDTPSTDGRIYWMTTGATAGKRVQLFKAGDFDTSVELSSFATTVERRDRVIRFAALTNGEAENFFGPAISSAPVEQRLNVIGLDQASGAGAVVEIALQGLTSHPHEVRVQLNGIDIGVVELQNRDHRSATFTVPGAMVQENENIVTLTRGGIATTDVTLVDYVRITYARTYRAANNRLRFSVGSGRAVRVDGFTNPNVRVLDITNSDIKELVVAAEEVDGSYSFTLPASTGVRTFLAFADEADHPTRVFKNEPSNLSNPRNGADFLIVTHRNFRQAVEPLRAWRQRQGLKTVVVDIEDIFDEFSFGAYSPQALHSFLAMTAHDWQRAPRYVLLVGDATFDPRRYLGGSGEGDLVPGLMVDTSFMEATSDDALADFDNDGLAEMAVGRLPIRTAQEASTLVNKIIEYDIGSHGDPFERGALIVSDRNDGFDFRDAGNSIGAQLPAGMTVEMVNREDGDTNSVRNQILLGINRGPMLVTYLGHGSVGVWTGDGILSVGDVASLTNGERLPLFVMTTCLNGSYMELGSDSMAEALIKAPQGGGVAVWASSGLTEPSGQVAVSHALYQSLFGGMTSGPLPIRLGDAIKLAKGSTSDIDIRRTWILVGDPTMTVK